jgi:hypothetical protein
LVLKPEVMNFREFITMQPPIIKVLLFVLALLTSCGLKFNEEKSAAEVELQQITGGDYSLGIPTYMTKATTLNDEASLQFQNLFKETYVIVIDENKEKFVTVFKNA